MQPGQSLLYGVTPTGMVAPVPAGTGAALPAVDMLPIGAYSVARTYDRHRFLGLDDHLARIDRTIDLLGWTTRLDHGMLLRAIDRVTREAPWHGDSTVRCDVLPAIASVAGIEAAMWIAIRPFVAVPEDHRRLGVGVHASDSLHRDRPLAKTTDFLARRRQIPPPDREHYEQLLIGKDGTILEGASSTFYAIRDGRIHTAGRDMLEGITRRIILELAREMEIPIVLEAPPLEQSPSFDGAFLTSSSRGVLPIVRIDDSNVGDGTPHPLATRLMHAYSTYAATHAKTALEVLDELGTS